MSDGSADRPLPVAPARPRRATARRFLPLLVVGAGLALAFLLGLHRCLSLDFLAASREMLKSEAEAHPLLGPIAFAALYALAVALCFPAASVLTIFAGFLFGWLVGGMLAVVAATAGAAVLFLAARTAFGAFLEGRVGSRGAKLSEGFRRDAFGYLLVLRLAPFIPFAIVNIAPALFGVRLRTFVAATFFGVIPAAFAYAWLGEGVDSVLLAAQASGGAPRLTDLATPQITVALCLLALLAALAAFTRRRHRTARGAA